VQCRDKVERSLPVRRAASSWVRPRSARRSGSCRDRLDYGHQIWCTTAGRQHTWPAADIDTAAAALADLARLSS
jgi:hypothetical protein